MAVVYGYIYLMFSLITQVFKDYYGSPTNLTGLAFSGLGIGSIIGIALTTTISDRHIKRRKQAEGVTAKPEYRLQFVPLGAVLVPAGLFIYGWTVVYHIN
ncbi:hypothetical protein BBP40_009207 [Aspergillus hancockii]|nr:hypothetical protein BBP40_009207 [Aspergillus hancockii]